MMAGVKISKLFDLLHFYITVHGGHNKWCGLSASDSCVSAHACVSFT